VTFGAVEVGNIFGTTRRRPHSKEINMACEVKYNQNHHAGATLEARIANRLRNSGGEEADLQTRKACNSKNTNPS
jgi:hypothetical protein